MFKKKRIKKLEESELIIMAKKSERAFNELYERNFEKNFRFVFKRLGGNEALTGEITQLTFIKAFASINKYEDRGFAFSTWLIRIAQNEINQYFRKNKKAILIEIEEKHVATILEECELENQLELQNKIITLLNTLPKEKQDLIELRFFQSLSFKEIAEIYNITEANAKMRIYRILENLKIKALK